MSLGARAPAPGLVTPAGVAARLRRALTSSSGLALAMRAFAGSRLIVLVAGSTGAATLTDHAAAPIRAGLLRGLGPVGNVLAGSAYRFDAGYYLEIAGHGYGSAAGGRIAFFPLYPVLIRAVGLLTRSDVIAGALVSLGCFALALVLLHRLTELELGRRPADATVLLLAFSPLSFFFSAVYTEALFLALSVATVLAARRDRWELACALATLAALTRPTGVLLALALVVLRIRTLGRLDRRLAGALAPPAALLAYLGALAANGYPWLAPFGAEHQFGRVSAGPLGGVASGLVAGARGIVRVVSGRSPLYHPSLAGPLSQAAESVVLLVVLLLALGALVGCRRRLAPELFWYAAAVLVVCVSSPVAGQPLWSLDRYVLTIFPLWMAAGAWVAARRLERPAVLLGSLLLAFYTAQFASWAFIA